MAKVIMLTHNTYHHRQTDIRFDERVVTVDGVRQYLATAEMNDEIAKEHFDGHPSFLVEYAEQADAPAMTDEEKAQAAEDAAKAEAEAKAAEDAAKAAEEAKTDDKPADTKKAAKKGK